MNIYVYMKLYVTTTIIVYIVIVLYRILLEYHWHQYDGSGKFTHSSGWFLGNPLQIFNLKVILQISQVNLHKYFNLRVVKQI